MVSNVQIPKTNDDQVFENQIRTLYAHILGDSNLKKHGTSGQRQDGVDLVGRRKADGSRNWVGIQCKQTGKDKIKTSTVRDEANMALKFEPPLKEFFIVTQANDCTNLDKEARLFTDEQEKLGREFEVHVIGWDQITSLIQESPHADVLNIFGINNEAQLQPVLRIVEETGDQVLSRIDSLEKTLTGVAYNNSHAALSNNAFSTEGMNTVIDKQIDAFRNLLEQGQVNAAKEALEQLWNDLPDDVVGRIKYRVKANIAACLLNLGFEDEAAKTYKKACDYAPDAPKADAHKVLYLILSEKYQEALEFGKACLETTKDIEALIANTIMALKSIDDNEWDISFIPEELLDNKSILISLTDLYRSNSHNDRNTWRQTARKAYDLYPNEKLVKRFYAEAILDEAFEEWDNKRGTVSVVSIAEKIEPALEIMEEIWNQERKSDTAGDGAYLSIAANLSNGYRFVDAHEKAINILEEALEKAPEDQDLKEHRLRVAFETNDGETVRRLVNDFPVTRDIQLGRLQILFNEGDWKDAYELDLPESTEGVNEYDLSFFESIKLLAGFKAGIITSPKEAIKKLFEKFPEQAIVPITAYQIAYDLKDKEWANELYLLAKSLKKNIPPSQRLMLAEISEDLGDFQNIIDVLQGHILENVDSPSLRILAVSYANTTITEQAVNFASNMNKDLLKQDFYARVKGSIHYNHGDLKAAFRAFETAISISKNNVAAHMGILRTLLRLDKKKQIEHHLKTLNMGMLEGPGYLKMAVAQLQLRYGDTEKGLKFGYDVALSDQGNEQVALFYIGMILPNSKTVDLPSPGNVVTDDCWLILEDEQGGVHDFIISPHLDKSEFNHYLPDHEVSKILIGKSLGEEVDQVPLAGTKKSFKVLQIKNRYVGFLHHTMNNFSTRFAGSQKLYSYTTEGDDVQPILDDIKKWSEADDQIYALYVDKKLPLSFLSSFGRGNVIEFANSLVNRGHVINTCMGTHEERQHGHDLCSIDDYNGVVLDTYTIWLSHAYNLIAILKEKFGRVAIAQSSIDELIEWRQKYEENDNEPLLTIGYKDGGYVGQEIAQESLQATYQTLDEAIKHIKETVEVLPAAPLENLGRFEEEIRLSPNGNCIFDPIYIAQKEGMLLLSEDMSYRTIAKQISGVDGVWLQVAMLSCSEDEIIDLKEYARVVSLLAEQKHGHLSLTALTLLSLCEEDNLEKYQSALFFIGTPTADLRSHINVVEDFLKILWASKLPRLTKSKASGLILDRLVQMMVPHEKDLDLLINLCRNNNKSISDYIRGWVFGHYFTNI